MNQPVEAEAPSLRKETLFIINPAAGTKAKDKITLLIGQHLSSAKFNPHVVLTQYPGHATELAREAVRQGFDYVVAVGGDGTINEVARALVHTPTVLGIVPVGSGNGLARHLGIPIHAGQALQRIERQRRITMDSGTLNDLPFFGTAGVGFDAHVGYLFSQSKHRGFGTYVQTTMQELFRYQPASYRLTVGGRTKRRKAFAVTFANASQYGNNAFVAPQADVQDGLLDVCTLRPFPLPAFVDLSVRLFSKTIHTSPYVEIVRASQASLKGTEPLRIHLDGESHETGDTLTVRVKPLSLKVMV
ncbi:MAG: diacylglycerol kinase family lipid kinase [Ferruginibacter sp.]|nr:diacylglycerol kinase family lipid kinase [Cytophagales bacterium]